MAGCAVVAAYPPGSDLPLALERAPRYTAELAAMGVEMVDTIPALLEKVDAVLLDIKFGDEDDRLGRPLEDVDRRFKRQDRCIDLLGCLIEAAQRRPISLARLPTAMKSVLSAGRISST